MLDDSELYFGEREYERRLVAFFDILGWKNEIDEAGANPKRVARLGAAVQLFASQVGTVNEQGAFLTTFSDNVVFSKLYNDQDELVWLLQGLAATQLGLATIGFWIRGGVTVGNLIHDARIVFGPALNRAYELECREAKYPRIVVDGFLSASLPINTDFLTIEEEAFVDPYRPEFWDRVQRDHPVQQSTLDAFEEMAGITLPKAEASVSGLVALRGIATRLSAVLTTTSKPEVWKKLAWVFDRIMPRIGSEITSELLPKSEALKEALAANPAL